MKAGLPEARRCFMLGMTTSPGVGHESVLGISRTKEATRDGRFIGVVPTRSLPVEPASWFACAVILEHSCSHLPGSWTLLKLFGKTDQFSGKQRVRVLFTGVSIFTFLVVLNITFLACER